MKTPITYVRSKDAVLGKGPGYAMSGGIGDIVKGLYHGMPGEANIWLASMNGFADECTWKSRLKTSLELMENDPRIEEVFVFDHNCIFQQASGFGEFVSSIKNLCDENNSVFRPQIVSSKLCIETDPDIADKMKASGRESITILPFAAGHEAWRGDIEFYRELAERLADKYLVIFVGDRHFMKNYIHESLSKLIDDLKSKFIWDETEKPNISRTWTAAKMSKFRITDHTMGHALFSAIPNSGIFLSARKDLSFEALRYYILNYDEAQNLYIFDADPRLFIIKEHGKQLSDFVINWMDRSTT